jgi:hypothetical protein
MRRRFYTLVVGLSPGSAFMRLAGDELSVIDDPDLIRSALRGA